MTDAQIIDAAIRDPRVKLAHRVTNPDGTWRDPTTAELSAIAGTELVAEIQYLLAQEGISRALLEREDEVTLTSGSTSIGQGLVYSFGDKWDFIITATIGDSHRPVDVMTSREEFNRWWYEEYGTSGVNDEAVKLIQWDPATNGTPTFLLSPGRGSDTTLHVLYRREVSGFTASLFLATDHHVLLEGLKNRMSGGALEAGYQKSLQLLKQRAHPILHRPTPMRRDPRVERVAAMLRSEYSGGGVNEPSHYYRRP